MNVKCLYCETLPQITASIYNIKQNSNNPSSNELIYRTIMTVHIQINGALTLKNCDEFDLSGIIHGDSISASFFSTFIHANACCNRWRIT